MNGGDAVADTGARDLVAALDEASISRFHMRAVLASGVGFFTDAYDLFVIGVASALITKDWHLSSGQLAILNSPMLGAAFLGALVFGRYADLAGRKRGLSGSYWVLIGFRFLLGIGVGGDYPVKRGHGERVREPQGPRQAGRHGVRHPGARADRRAADRAGPARLRRQHRHSLAGAVRAGRGARRRRDLVAQRRAQRPGDHDRGDQPVHQATESG
jgi:hypothetical protein